LSSINESSEQLKRAEAIFHEALDAPEEDRLSLIEARCEGDVNLVNELLALIEGSNAHELRSKDGSASWIDLSEWREMDRTI